MTQFLDLLQHLPDHIAQWSAVMGPWVYVLLFAIVFAETGFVVTPILPGDSLLFAAGVLTMQDGPLSLPVLAVVFALAAIGGDLLNYSIGRWVGRVVMERPSRWLNPMYLKRAEEFYRRHGGKAVILARFFPIIRTYAPFVAGMSRMPRPRYVAFSVVGGCLWTWSFLFAGHWFGNLPIVKTSFHYILLAIVVVSLLPAVFQFFLNRGGRDGEKQTNALGRG